MSVRPFRDTLMAAGTLGLLTAASLAAAPPERIRFNQHIRPLLSDRCFFCHGPDEKNRQGDLRLDTREGALRDLGGAAAVVPGKPEASTLLERVTSHDLNERMPPPRSKKTPLSAEEVARLRLWIEQGAEYEGHWAFLPLADEPPPATRNNHWVRNPIDRFILARLERDGIPPSPEADRATLLRRVSLDLTGLPPSFEAIASFAADPSPEAYEMAVDRLLQSPHYGERWGRHWLDQARYADSNGYSVDGEREMWPFRDWVINALNDDLPFEQFTIEQLAGDLLPNAHKNQLVATAFHRNTLINQEGGVDREQFRVESLVDRVNTTGAVWLGLTIGCAQCHSHKFDPIAQREFYQLLAFFNATEDANDRGPVVEVARGEVFGHATAADIEPQPPSAAERAQRQAAWEKAQLARLEALRSPNSPTEVTWTPSQYVSAKTSGGLDIGSLGDGTLLVPDKVGPQDTYVVVVKTALPQVAAIRLRVLTHDSLPKRGPGLASNGNFVLSELAVRRGAQPVPLFHAMADHQQPGYPITAAIDGDPKTGWAINVAPGSTARMNADHEAIFYLTKTVATDGEPLELRLFHQVNANYQIGRFALDFSAVAPRPPRGADDELLAALRVPPSDRGEALRKTVGDAFERSAPAERPREKTPRPDIAQVMVMRDRPQPRETFLLTRGDFTRPDKDGGPLQPGVLRAIAPELPEASSARSRLDLARWLVHPDNPLTPRVTMNRLWLRYFGRGLVETEEDFGTQGTPPTHPELLDWLAREFIRRGWSLKAMHRLMVTSATYRQSSRARPDLVERDPRNLLLARQERLRFEAEVVRDAALSASGLLDRTIGGPSVRPPQPDGVYAFTQTAKSWTVGAGGSRFRRGLYTFFYRSAPYPLLTTFDAPDFQTVCTRRLRSNTPLQSLTLANDTAFLELAQALAARVVREHPGDFAGQLESRIRLAFQLALAREPSARELATLLDYARRQQDSYANNANGAEALRGEELAGLGIAPPAGATIVCVARVLLNSDNFITRE